MTIHFDTVEPADRTEAIRDGIARAAYRGDYGIAAAVEIGRLAAEFDAAIPGRRPIIALAMQGLASRQSARRAA